jgi:hypothetical protein
MKTKILLYAIALVAGGLGFHDGFKSNGNSAPTRDSRWFTSRSEPNSVAGMEAAPSEKFLLLSEESSRARKISQLFAAIAGGGNPGKAAGLAEAIGPGEDRDRLMDRIARAWAIASPEAAMEWAQSRKDEGERTRLWEVILQEREKRDATGTPESEILDDLTVAVRGIGPNNEGEIIVHNLTQKWAARNYAATLAWVRQQPASDLRDHLITRVAMARCDTAPPEAALLVAQEITSESIQDEAVIAIVHQWGRSDSKSARIWVDEFPDCMLKQRAKRELEGIAAMN